MWPTSELAHDPDVVTTTLLMRRSTFVSELVWMHVMTLHSQIPPASSAGPVISTIDCETWWAASSTMLQFVA